MSRLAGAALASLAVAVAGSAPAAAQASRPAQGERQVALKAQPGWTEEAPTSRMRLAQFLLPAKEGGEDLRLVVYHFGAGQGGGAQANLERWAAQIKTKEGAPPRQTSWVQHGLAVTTIDALGDFKQPTFGRGKPGPAKPNHRLLGAVVEGADGPYFVKLVGPAADVGRWEASYGAFVRSLNPGSTRKVIFNSQPGWTAGPSTSRMRAASFVLPPASQQGEGPTLVVYHFGEGKGGDVAANMKRWIGQLQQPDGSSSQDAAKRATRKQGGLTIHTLDLSGTYVAETRPGSGERVNRPNQRLLAAVIEGADGPYFVKLIGPADAIAAQEKNFAKFLEGIEVLEQTREF
ncbi:MAG TPA: hypothetical protein DEA08_39570 [Planctomycetes bacterium]|nr:hypothetical protein [Planctomycetota bacterium]